MFHFSSSVFNFSLRPDLASGHCTWERTTLSCCVCLSMMQSSVPFLLTPFYTHISRPPCVWHTLLFILCRFAVVTRFLIISFNHTVCVSLYLSFLAWKQRDGKKLKNALVRRQSRVSFSFFLSHLTHCQMCLTRAALALSSLSHSLSLASVSLLLWTFFSIFWEKQKNQEKTLDQRKWHAWRRWNAGSIWRIMGTRMNTGSFFILVNKFVSYFCHAISLLG